MAGYLDRVNRTKVTAKLLREVMEMHAWMAPEDRPVLEARSVRLFELLKSKGVHPNRMGRLATAIHFRLEALARLQQDAVLRGWTLPCEEPGAVSLSFDVIKAAAEQQLIENEGNAAFEAESFRRRILARAKPDGRA